MIETALLQNDRDGIEPLWGAALSMGYGEV
jgi:hypothetical protein